MRKDATLTSNTVSAKSTETLNNVQMQTMQTIQRACEQACLAIAPAWPLDRAIAVNPHWSRINKPVREVAARMAVLGGISVFPSRRYIQQAWQEGRIQASDLEVALATTKVSQHNTHLVTQAQCIAALAEANIETVAAEISRLPLLIDLLDEHAEHVEHADQQSRLTWRDAIVHQISQTCAAYFDEQQADWQTEHTGDLYGFWRETLTHDYGIGVLMGLPDLGKSLKALPATREDAEQWVMQRLRLPEAIWPDYLEAVLLTVNGWASWCAYLGWQAQLDNQSSPHLRDLLAIRLAWGAILLDCKDRVASEAAFQTLQTSWQQAPQKIQTANQHLLIDEVWQVALELGYQRQLAVQLNSKRLSKQQLSTPHLIKPHLNSQKLSTQNLSTQQALLQTIEVQAAFCIDVRSEPLRRALETISPAIQTIGFAGFFGLPLAYTPFANTSRRPQLPGLIAPSIEVHDHISISGNDSSANTAENSNQNAQRARQRRFAWSEQWHTASRWPSAAFSFVEAVGVSYVGQLLRCIHPSQQSRVNDDKQGLPTRYKTISRPRATSMSLDDKVTFAARILHAMGLDQHLAPLVLLVGHGSQSANNAQSAALDCGACCGQTGEVNARVLAHLLNEPTVRSRLQEHAISIPEETVFIAALHNTTTDEIEGFDIDLMSSTARQRWDNAQTLFIKACDQVRRERAPSLGLDPHTPQDALLTQLRRRANDAAQTRPEWGLAGNASMIIAPRERSRGLTLNGRTFLQDYEATQDADGSVLALLMTAPMVVANWINWQYHASICEPKRFGSGNKVLHNVVGGHLGVFEGNGGDLRIGLSQQSLHNGSHCMHEPLRLTVVIDAPSVAIDLVIQKNASVRHLIENQWLHLWRFDHQQLQHYVDGQWQTLLLS